MYIYRTTVSGSLSVTRVYVEEVFKGDRGEI